MEVHHHGHVHHEKKWKTYLFQFFMLFLAVFLGFLAEYQLEHKIEKSREKEYIKLMVEDLQTDADVIRQAIPNMRQSVRGLDTLIDQTYLFLGGKGDTRVMYYTYHYYCRNRFDLELSQRALNQLKNSGNMRLIHDKMTSVIVAGIESGFDLLFERTKYYKMRQEDASSFGLKIFDFGEYQKANLNKDGSIKQGERGFLSFDYQPALNCTDPIYLKEFIAHVGYYRNSFHEYIRMFEDALPKIEEATKIIADNYHIDMKTISQN